MTVLLSAAGDNPPGADVRCFAVTFIFSFILSSYAHAVCIFINALAFLYMHRRSIVTNLPHKVSNGFLYNMANRLSYRGYLGKGSVGVNPLRITIESLRITVVPLRITVDSLQSRCFWVC